MYKTVLTNELEQKMNKVKVNIIDIREKDEYNSGHINGVLLIPMSEFGKHLDKIKKEEHYYIICHSGNRSQVVSKYLSENGYDVTNVLGGISAYTGKLDYEV